jgi:uncharacterized protein (TIGR02145 family)
MKNLILILLFVSITLVSKAQRRDSTFTDARDGKKYKTVKIGTQTWMAENLAYKVDSGCWAYDNKDSNVAIYGYLYDWETAKKVCPKGWHLPSNEEWRTLIYNLGGNKIAGGKMKEAGEDYWHNPNTGATNSSGFNALPAGYRYLDGSFDTMGFYTIYRSSKEKDDKRACIRGLSYGNAIVTKKNYDKRGGFSVRCIKG